MTTQQATNREVAFYYPGHLWHNPEWIKSLLLFFDGIGLLVPEYKLAELEKLDPVLAEPLRDKGLLHYFVADQAVDKEATQRLAEALSKLIASGALDPLAKQGTAFHAISMSRMGYFGDFETAEKLFEALEVRGLARKSHDGVSIPLHPTVRYLILTLLAQILRPKGSEIGATLSPATDQPKIVRALGEFLSLPGLPSAGHVVAFDLQSVSVNLSAVPLDEVLAFRTEHKRAHREYIRSVRRFTHEVSLIPELDRTRAFDDRQEDLDDLASDLRKKSRSAWRKPASFALALAGAYWTYHTGDVVVGLLGAGALAAGGIDKAGSDAGAYSYLFAANEQYA